MGTNRHVPTPSFHSLCQNLIGNKNTRTLRIRILATLIYWQCFIWFLSISCYLTCSTSKVAIALTRWNSGKKQIRYVNFPIHAAIALRSGCVHYPEHEAIQFNSLSSPSFFPLELFQTSTHWVQRKFKLTTYTRRDEIFGFHFTGITAGSQSV